MKTLLSQLNMEIIMLDLRHPVEKLPDLFPYVGRIVDSSSIEVELRKEQNVNLLFQKLTESGIQISSVRSKSSRLEELFIHLVNKN
jgi:ABC-2 type transport system ATP-binding protein